MVDQLAIEVDGFPSAVRPMQAVSAQAPFSSEEYLFEGKWDGLRCLLFVVPDGECRLQDRALGDITSRVPELAGIARQVTPRPGPDGELVSTDSEGRPDYQALRQRLSGKGSPTSPPLAFLAFDALYVGGGPLPRQPLIR